MSHDHKDGCGCGDDGCDSDHDADMGDIATEKAELNVPVDLSHDGGVKKTIKRAGTGWNKPPTGAEVSVHYVGTLESDGSEFDSSRGRGEPFVFKLGQGQVIKGWDLGVASMKKGELAVLTCSAAYAYGDSGSPPKIPGGATLNFEVELLSWTDEKDVSAEKDGSLTKKTLKEGDGWEQPGEDATVTVKYVARLAASGAEVDRSDSCVFGVGEENAPTAALDRAVQNMKKQETAQITAAPKHCYGAKGCPEKGIPADAALVYEVTLLDLKKPKMAYEMEAPELLKSVEEKRLEGNELYKAGRTARALRRYKKALEFLDQSDYKLSDELKKQAKAAKVPCMLNVAACKIATKEYKEAAEQCTKALEIESSNVRALTRRGKAYVLLDEWDLAQRDLDRAVELDPKNADALRERAALLKLRAENDKKLKGKMQGMFDRMAKLEEADKKAAEREAALLVQQQQAEEAARKKREEEEAAKKKAEADAKPAEAAAPTDVEMKQP